MHRGHRSGAVGRSYGVMGGKITLAIRRRFGYNSKVSSAGVMELVDVVDSKSTAGDSVPVRVRSPAPRRSKRHIVCSDFFTKVRARSRRCSSFPNRTRCRWASVWGRRFAAVLSYCKKILDATSPSTSYFRHPSTFLLWMNTNRAVREP